MLYSLHCLQNGNIMHSGRNSATKDQVKECLLSYLSADHDEAELAQLATVSPDELAGMYDFTIEEHATPYADD